MRVRVIEVILRNEQAMPLKQKFSFFQNFFLFSLSVFALKFQIFVCLFVLID